MDALSHFQEAVAHGANRSATILALAESSKEGRDLSVSDLLKYYVPVSSTTVRIYLRDFLSLGLIELCPHRGPRTYWMTDFGAEGYEQWLEKDGITAARKKLNQSRVINNY